ncbi:MAG: protein-L-isoaspartate(D-aspartate) O-methyltransferase [Planctomycetes bacterium]|nr:protein-L-isoaspartate(D-aspartate) O-methyltransferase [Planctomycetota bacterium]MBM4086136.1 protein-L-isoaspartate(D-aspartate) O-methyltransferase [Planctomycetota bacterium]
MSDQDPFAEQRRQMVEYQIRSRDIHNEAVLAAMRKIPRERFVREADLTEAYTDHPLAIGHGQTISQPYMVALMTQELQLKKTDKVLEIGTGSGYQAAVLTELAAQVYTVERIAALSDHAREVILALGYTNVHFKVSDGTLGWPEEAPFDKIIVTAGAPSIPKSLVAQLRADGLLVIPVGDLDRQTLIVGAKQPDGSLIETSVCSCIFVKLKGKEGW